MEDPTGEEFLGRSRHYLTDSVAPKARSGRDLGFWRVEDGVAMPTWGTE